MAVLESLSEYFLHQHRNLENYLLQCKAHAEPEVVHQLRLSIKKLRAFNKLATQLGLQQPEEYKKVAQELKKLFSLAGQIRDVQVQIQLLAEYEEHTNTAYPEFGKWLLSIEKKRIAHLNSLSSNFFPLPDGKSSRQENAEEIGTESNETFLFLAEGVLNELFTKAQKLATGYIIDADMHRIRRVTKQLRYILNVVHYSFPDYAYKRITIADIREIESVVGSWHDKLIRRELLESFLKKFHKPDKTSQTRYQKLADIFTEEQNSAYENACQVVKAKLLL
jgi:CHAD domain-containing protein